MSTPEGRWTIVFNGEVYNYRELRTELQALGHRFRTNSDTEVLLACWAEWGVQCLPKLVGMFAFAVFDSETESLTCVRDAFGIKPFFFAATDSCLYFASEPRALIAMMGSPPEPNRGRIIRYLRDGAYDAGSDTFWNGIHHLPPGHLAVIDTWKDTPGAIRPERWWWPTIEQRDISLDAAAGVVRELFLDNIRLHLRSDVPIGAALSGGVDSSAVIAGMRHIEPELPIATFSFVSPGTSVDESRWVDVAAGHVGAKVHKVQLSAHDLANDIDDVIWAQGEPFGSTSIYAQYAVYRRAREAGITVMLDGQGADELFAGYHGYPSDRLRSLLEQRNVVGAQRFLRAWSTWPGRDPRGLWRAAAVGMAPDSVRGRLRRSRDGHRPEWLTGEGLDALMVSDMSIGGSGRDVPRGRQLASRLRNALTAGDLTPLLRHADRNSMKWSVESRVPFLTTQMAEFTLSLPENFLISPEGQTKSVFKAAMRGIVSNEILDRRDKIGFETPEGDWLRLVAPQVDEWLEGLTQLDFIEIHACRRMVRETLRGSRRFTGQTWRIINLARWSQLAL